MTTYIRYLLRLVPILLLLTTPACTHCDGDIGPLFGSWHIESIDIDGEPEEGYDAGLMISFQGEICNIAYLSYDFDRYDLENYGTWRRDGDRLTLTLGYQHRDSSLFDPFPPALGFPSGAENVTVDITEEDTRHMRWRYVTDAGTTIDYVLRKYP